jgi:hypothetical protein
MFDYVVVDTASLLDELLLSLLEKSDQVLMVVDMDLPSVKNAKLALETLRLDILGYGPIDPLLNDEDVTEVMVNGPYDVYVERKRQAREDPTSASSTRRTCGASSTRSWARSAAASTRPPRWSTPASPTAPV